MPLGRLRARSSTNSLPHGQAAAGAAAHDVVHQVVAEHAAAVRRCPFGCRWRARVQHDARRLERRGAEHDRLREHLALRARDAVDVGDARQRPASSSSTWLTTAFVIRVSRPVASAAGSELCGARVVRAGAAAARCRARSSGRRAGRGAARVRMAARPMVSVRPNFSFSTSRAICSPHVSGIGGRNAPSGSCGHALRPAR